MVNWKIVLMRLSAVLILLSCPSSAFTQTKSITIGYSQFFQTTRTHNYYNEIVGGKSIGYGIHFSHTRSTERHFLSVNIGNTWSRDSIVIHPLNSPPSKAMQQLNVLDIGFNFGIGRSLQFNSFLSLYLGGGLHYARITYDYAGIAPKSNPGVTTELLACARYEFEHFFVVGTYSYLFTINEMDILTHRHGFRLGISLPYRRD